MQTKFAFLLLSLFLSVASLSAQITPAEVVTAMGRGINLGNTLEPPTESAWNNGPAQESYFDRYVEAGFTNVRIPVRWDEHTQDAAPFTIDASWMDRVEEVVDWGLDRGLYITLNGHHEDWLKSNYSNPTLRDRYDAIWEQVSERFQNKSERLLFEIINEPNGMTVAQVDDLNERILGIIRQNNPTRIVIYGGNMYSNAEQLYDAAIPDDDYIVGYFHSYDPWPFAGQGNGTWGSEADYQQMANKFQTAANWSAANDVPIHVSEFGAVVDCDFNSRMRYYAAYVDEVVKHGFAFSVWDDGGMFRVLNRNTGQWPETEGILMHTYGDSPDQVFTSNVTDAEDEPAVLVEWRNRSTENDSIRVERKIGASNFGEIIRLAPDATTYLDTSVILNATYTYRLVTFRPDGTELQGYPSRVRLATVVPQSAFNGVIAEIPGRIEAENFDVGGEDVSYHDNDPDNIPGFYRPDEGVDVEENGSGGLQVGYVNFGEWMEYTVNVTQAGTYELDANLASEVGNGSMRIEFSGSNDFVIFTVPSNGTGGWTTHQNFQGSNTIDLTEGEQIMRITIVGTDPFNIDFVNFTLADEQTVGIVNYFDGLEEAGDDFSGNPGGMTYALENGVLTITGDGTASPYQNINYTLPDGQLADVIGSDDKLYVRARTRSGNPAKLRIDLVDGNNYHTTNGSISVDVSGTDYQEYLFAYEGVYQDEAYGGTGCTSGPCPVNGSRIVSLTIYPDPDLGGLDEIIDIEYFSFGVSLVNTRDFAELAGLEVYPNPSKDIIQVSYDLPEAAEVGLLVFDQFGRRVLQRQLGRQSGSGLTTTLDVDQLPAGTYFVSLTLDGVSSSGRKVLIR